MSACLCVCMSACLCVNMHACVCGGGVGSSVAKCYQNLEPNCEYSSSSSSCSSKIVAFKDFFCVKIFPGAYGLSKHLPVFLLGTENFMGGWMAIVVVVCGNICGKMCGKIKKLLDQKKFGVVLDLDPVIMLVVTKRQKRQKGKKAKRQKDKNAKRQKDKKAKR